MSMSDPLADMFTRIRNGALAKFEAVQMPSSKTKVGIAKVMKDEGYITNFSVEKSGNSEILSIQLKYGANGESAISKIKRISKPGLRKYSSAADLPIILNGLGISIVSTSKGITTDKIAREQNIGGEIFCEIW